MTEKLCIMNYILVSHCSFNGNSGIHAYQISEEMVKLGVDCVVAVPDTPESAFKIGRPSFKVITYGAGVDILKDLFDNSQGADVIHAFTPRQHVRNETLRLADFFNAPYVVHLEDNEEEILRAGLGVKDIDSLCDLPALHLENRISLWRAWPAFYRSFLINAIGITALIDRLLEFNYAQRPSLVFWPGFDHRYLKNSKRSNLQQRYNLPKDKRMLVYTGMVHEVNFGEVETLLLAVSELNRRGHEVRLVKTGNDTHKLLENLPKKISDYVIDLGFIDREDLPQLVKIADVLVQPGRSDAFNDYRFPSKLPEFFASGRPVVLPKTNIGLHITDGVNGVLLEEGDYRDIADKVEQVFNDPNLSKHIGEAGRDFAAKKLNWGDNVRKIHDWFKLLLKEEIVKKKSIDVDISLKQYDDPKLIAFYLPQFHPIPENDQWWGKGFTEWTNVKRGSPNFKGHYMPRLPAELGFYDLREQEIMKQQAEIAKTYGIFGFCFYYYWFSGKRLLEKPLETLLSSEKPDFPFCLCWANENWTRRWDGMDEEILIKQGYENGWEEQFFLDILPYFRDSRYIRIDGEPLLVLYRVDTIPDCAEVIKKWKHKAKSAGLPGLHVVGVQYIGMSPEMPVEMGADATVEFPPHLMRSERTFIDPAIIPDINDDFNGYVEDYPSAMMHYISRPAAKVPWYRCLMPSWDNTARRGLSSHIYVNATPKLYERWLRYLVDYSRCAPGGRPIIFVNAWNEWAEGAYLEPDRKYGWQYLEATSLAMRGYLPVK